MTAPQGLRSVCGEPQKMTRRVGKGEQIFRMRVGMANAAAISWFYDMWGTRKGRAFLPKATRGFSKETEKRQAENSKNAEAGTRVLEDGVGELGARPAVGT